MALFQAEIKVKLKKGVADPEGANTRRALEMLGFKGITEMKSIKSFELSIKANDKKTAMVQIEDMCRRLLANPVIHNYSITLEKV
jgi:phosphoribosylformylglycinamidine synthase PurS subunit